MAGLSADALVQELLDEAMSAGDDGFTLTKILGTVQTGVDKNGLNETVLDVNARTQIEMNAAAVRLLKERLPQIKVTYPQTKLSEKTVLNNDEPMYFTETRTDAVITVPAEFVQEHTGMYFRQIMLEKWSEQLDRLLEEIVSRLRKHELRTQQMFGKAEESDAAVSFRVTCDSVESDIWTVILQRCGLYPLQWDGEVCGMALLLTERLKTMLADDFAQPPEISVKRDERRTQCSVFIHYSIKQD